MFKNGFLKFGICDYMIADNLKDDLYDESTDEELSHDEITNISNIWYAFKI
jgi:hypothetical protein